MCKVWFFSNFFINLFNKNVIDIYYNGNIILFMGINENLMKVYGYEFDLFIFNEMMSLLEFIVN